MKIKWRHRQHCEWSRQQHVLLYVIKWQMIRFQALWKTKSFVKVCLKFKLPLWTKGLLIHLSPLWQLPLWHFPWWHNFLVCVWYIWYSFIQSHIALTPLAPSFQPSLKLARFRGLNFFWLSRAIPLWMATHMGYFENFTPLLSTIFEASNVWGFQLLLAL